MEAGDMVTASPWRGEVAHRGGVVVVGYGSVVASSGGWSGGHGRLGLDAAKGKEGERWWRWLQGKTKRAPAVAVFIGGVARVRRKQWPSLASVPRSGTHGGYPTTRGTDVEAPRRGYASGSGSGI